LRPPPQRSHLLFNPLTAARPRVNAQTFHTRENQHQSTLALSSLYLSAWGPSLLWVWLSVQASLFLFKKSRFHGAKCMRQWPYSIIRPVTYAKSLFT
jgi:hypothetical protein